MASNYSRTIMNLPYSSVDIWLRIPMAFKEPKEHSLEYSQKKIHTLKEVADDENKIMKINELKNIDNAKKKRKIDTTNVEKIVSDGLIPENTISVNKVIDNTVFDSYVLWDNFRHISNSDRRVFIALEFSTEKDLNICTTGIGKERTMIMLSYHCILCYIISYYIILYHIILCCIILYSIILYYIILYCITLYHIKLYHIILYYIILYHTVLNYVNLYYILLGDRFTILIILN